MSTPKSRREGYLLIDNRLAPPEPGIPRYLEAATMTCAHCQRQLIRNPERKREREWCRGCDSYICDPCAAVKAVAGCRTFKQILDENDRLIARSSNGLRRRPNRKRSA